MVDIKGLDKARVLKALHDEKVLPITIERCKKLVERQKYFDTLHGRVLKVDLSGDEFDERMYDEEIGSGAAWRAIDRIRAEQDADKNADGEKKEPSLEEQAKMTKEAVHKIIDILNELPPTAHVVASMMLKMMLSGPLMGGMSGLLMMDGPFAPSPFKTFGARGPKERDIMSAGLFGPFGGIGK